MVFELALALMPVTRTGFVPQRGHEPADAVPRYAASMAEAGEIVRRWPGGLLDALVERVAERAVSRPNVRYMGPGNYLAGLTSRFLPKEVADAIASALEPITFAPGTNASDQIGMREATFLTGQEERKLAAARRSGHLITRICLRANRLLPTLDRQEMEWLADFLEHRLSAGKVSDRLRLPRYAIDQLVNEKLLVPVSHPYVIAHYDRLQLHAAELTRFQRRILDIAVPLGSLVDPVPLHRVARGIGGGAHALGTDIFGSPCRVHSPREHGRIDRQDPDLPRRRVLGACISRQPGASSSRWPGSLPARRCRGAESAAQACEALPGTPTPGALTAFPGGGCVAWPSPASRSRN